MKFMNIARHWLWLAPLVIGVVFVAAGAYTVIQGRDARNTVHDQIVAEQITTSPDASIPNVLVDDAGRAQSQADAIQGHILNLTGGKTYAQLDKNDPNRDTVLKGDELRTSLNLAVMGFKVSDLVVGIGIFMLVIGGTFIFFLAPAVFYAAAVANHYNELMKDEKRRTNDTPRLADPGYQA